MPSVEIREVGGKTRVYPLNRACISFGRSSTNNIVLLDPGVSRDHGRFFRQKDGQWLVEDLDSTNGIRVGQASVTRHNLSHGDVIQIGNTALTFLEETTGVKQASGNLITLADLPNITGELVEYSSDIEGLNRQRLTALYDLGKRLIDQRQMRDLINEASSVLATVLNADCVVIAPTCNPDQNPDALVSRPGNMNVLLSRSVVTRTIQMAKPILLSSIKHDPNLATSRSVLEGDIRSAICVPLMWRNCVKGFVYLDRRQCDRSYEEDDIQFACAVGALVGIAVENARLHEGDLIRQRMEAELANARQVQQAILPSQWPQLDGWDVHGIHRTCYEVGGDYYDAIISDDGHLWLLIADVAGKGAPAAILSSCIHACVQVAVRRCDSPAQFMGQLNDLLLCRGFDQPFVTCLVATVTLSNGKVVIASAGHPNPVFMSPGIPAFDLEIERSPILGLERNIKFHETTWSFPNGQGTLLLYTDGITEAMDDHKAQYGVERLRTAVNGCNRKSAENLNRCVLQSVEQFHSQASQTDDITLLACQRLG